MPEARVRIGFPEATQEAFEAFADEVAAVLPNAEVTYQDKPLFGAPYIWVRHNMEDYWYGWILSIDAGQELCVGDSENNCWVESSGGLQ